MSPAGVMPLLLEVVVPLDPAARCTGELRRQHRDASRSLYHGHAPMHRLPGVVRSFVVVPRGRPIALRDPVDHDRGQQIVLAKTRLDVAVTIAPAAEFLDYPGKQSHWRIIERHRDRLRLGALQGRIGRLGGEEVLQSCGYGRLVGVIVFGRRRAAAEQVQRQHHREVHAHHAGRIAMPQIGRDQRAPVGAVRGESRIAQLFHELHPKSGSAPEIDAGLTQRRGESIARQRRHHHVEGIRRIAAVRAGIA